jgi:hypothetical protein
VGLRRRVMYEKHAVKALRLHPTNPALLVRARLPPYSTPERI